MHLSAGALAHAVSRLAISKGVMWPLHIYHDGDRRVIISRIDVLLSHPYHVFTREVLEAPTSAGESAPVEFGENLRARPSLDRGQGGYSNRVMVHCKQVCWQSTRSSSQHLHARSAHFFGGPI